MEKTYDFRHVQDDNGGFETDTDTSNQTTDDDSSKSISSTSNHLDDATNNVDQAAHDDSPFTSNAIRDITSDDGTEESTSREN